MNKSEQKRFEKIALLAINTFTDKEQREMLVEECSELILGIKKLNRAEKSFDYKILNNAKGKTNYKKWKENFIEEQVDVSIMLMQFFISLTPEDRNIYDKIFKYKINRLNNRINEYKEEVKYFNVDKYCDKLEKTLGKLEKRQATKKLTTITK